ncbi:MAG: flagellar motor switch protein FliG [Nitrospirae bacterium]|jgi:flagellar motor switch protein FliG|nr:flagellar motor switch protein FliG [Nitrospirota bacterium]
MSLSGYEKAAIFLLTVGEDGASEIVKNLNVKEIGRLTMHMTKLKSVSKNVIEEVLREASGIISDGDMFFGGEEYARKVLSKGLGEEGASRILEIASKEGPLDSLKWVEPKTLASFLVTEHPQTAALIISLLEPTQAADVLSLLPDEIKGDIAFRIATTEMIPESAIEDLSQILKGQLDVARGRGKKVGGTKKVAEILNNVDRSTEQVVLTKIEEQKAEVAESIRNLMFVFDDLVKLDDRAIQMILKEISTDELSLALKTASEALKEKIFKNMSQRAVEILKEEMQTRGPVKLSDVEKAQQNIVKIARRLEVEGKIIIASRGSEELVA